jgi:hypothetical protein
VRKVRSGAAAAAILAALVALFYRDLLFRGLILGDYDAFVYFYPLREYAAEALKQGRFPLWNPDLFLGAPFFANVQTAVLYPLNALFLWLPTPYAYSASVFLHLLLAGAAMYLFARSSLRVSLLPGLLAAITFMFSGFLTGQMGHINQLTVAAWMPMLLVAFDEAVRRRSLALGIATGLVGTLQLLAGHTQEWYFSTVTLGLFALWRVVSPPTGPRGSRADPSPRVLGPSHVPEDDSTSKEEPSSLARKTSRSSAHAARLWPLALLAVAGLVEIGTTAVQVLPSMELSAESIRGGGMSFGEAMSFSLPPTTALYSVLPVYPEQLFSEYVGYVGIIPLVLAALAVIAWSVRPVAAFMAGLVGLGLFMALGKYNPFYPFLFHWVPGLDLFRVPARWLLVYTFGMSGLAGLGGQLALDLGTRVPRVRRLRRGEKALSLLKFLAGALTLGAAIGLLVLFYRVARPHPTQDQLVVWNVLAGVTLGLVALGGLGRRLSWVALSLLILGATGELWVAGEMTSVRHPIPFEAYRPTRSSTSYLLGDAAKHSMPGRLLSFATDQYEVKETPDYKKEYGGEINPDALVQFMVDIKLSEVLAANIPTEYGIQTVDGYDGGILPLKRYGDLRSLLLPGLDIPPDVPLRTNLDQAPPLRLADLLNVRYLLGSKIQDTTIDGVYYDRGVSMILNPGQTEQLTRLPRVTTDAIGLISSTEGARGRKDGEVAAYMTITDASGVSLTIPLRFGSETGETPERDAVLPPPAHRKPPLVPAWTPKEPSTEYYAKVSLPIPMQVVKISIRNPLPEAKVRVRAISLINGKAGSSVPLVLSDQLDRQLFFDMKLYTNRDPLPRAFMVQNSLVRDDETALDALAQPQLALNQTVVLAPSATARSLYRPDAGAPETSEVRVSSYEAERVVVDVNSQQPGYLVLLDAFYPGWKAEVDGVEVPIERADYFFRAVYLNSGQHTVVFRYDPGSFRLGLAVSLASFGLVGAVLLFMAVQHGLSRRRTVV